MAEEQSGEKTEQPTQKKLAKAFEQGNIARSPEIQTVFVMFGALLGLRVAGPEIWRQLAVTLSSILGHLHDTPISENAIQGYAIGGVLTLGHCVWPILAATVIGGLLAGGLQTGFRTTSETLGIHWERLNPAAGFQRFFSMRNGVPALLSLIKLVVIGTLSYQLIKQVVADPIFYSSVDLARIAVFLADSSLKIITQVAGTLILVAAADYGYKYWQNHQDMMMTKSELKEESKSADVNPQVRQRMRRKRQAMSKRKMLLEVTKADVVVTNPTHIAIALRYDRKTMKAPKIVAKGIRLNAQQIREIARQHQVPIIENKPLARMMFKYGKVGGEIPAQLYAAVAEILATVYRVNAYRYYREQNT